MVLVWREVRSLAGRSRVVSQRIWTFGAMFGALVVGMDKKHVMPSLARP